MITIPGYQILTQIYSSANSLVYRAIREEDNQSVILKVLQEDYPTAQELTRYKQEYEITRNLNLDGVVKAYGLEPYQRTFVIILEDFGGSSLKQLINNCGTGVPGGAFPLSEFLKIAIKIAEVLGQIHSHNIIHKDLNPSNIVFNPETGIIKIIDFGISTQLTRENPTLKNPNILEGTLAYISPEQTGRMNRSLDYRTDFYSLGVTFYELLTGKLPFETTDALSLVHCHIAKMPMSPHQLNAEIPLAVSDIVMKLMTKTAEERYQSAYGIRADLETCLTQLQINGEIAEFPLGSNDISDKFQITQKLYGREKEVEALLTAFERVTGSYEFSVLSSELEKQIQNSKLKTQNSRSEMMLVAGYSGIGKSALVAEIHKPNTRLRGYFTEGKFDQFGRNIPYSAIVVALKGLVRQLLTESSSQLAQWRAKLLAAFGQQGKVIIDVIPEVELIVGKQPPVPELGPQEAQNRFNLVFGQFIRAFCTLEHPLVIFLDDLQWADSATLKLIELMMTDNETQYLFLIGAYRDNEVSPTHPLMMTLEGLRNLGATINFITLAPLEVEHISPLIADTLHSDTDEVKPLAELVKQKTGGNPFFANQFLKTLHAENLIAFDFQRHVFVWDISNIEAQNITDNVVELMIGKLKKLPPITQQVLRLAACVGAYFDLTTISIVCEKSPIEVFPALVTAIQSGLILPTSVLDTELLIQDYKFLHDRIQQAAYALITEEHKKEVHLKIGMLLKKNTSEAELEDKIFDIVNHLNAGVELLSEPQEKTELAKFNLIAGIKAKNSTAYQAAIKHFTLALEILPQTSWTENYQLTFFLYREAAECEYINGNFERAKELFDLALSKAVSDFDKVDIYFIEMNFCITKGDCNAGIDAGIEALNILGDASVSRTPEALKTAIETEFKEVNLNLEKRSIAGLLDMPELTDRAKNVMMRLWVDLSTLSGINADPIFPLTVAKIINMSLKYGNTSLSAFGYITYGMMLTKANKCQEAYEFGNLALKLNKKFNQTTLVGKINFLFANTINPYNQHLKTNLPFYQESYQFSMAGGDLTYSVWALYFLFWTRLEIGENINSLSDAANKYLSSFEKFNDQNMIFAFQTLQRFLGYLQGKTEHKYTFKDEIYQEQQCLEAWESTNLEMAINWYSYLKAQLFYIYENYEEAYIICQQVEHQVDSNLGFFPVTKHNLYYSLSLTSIYPKALLEVREVYWKTLEENQKKMEIWAKSCPANFQHQYLLIEAEIARISNRGIEAMDLYDRAIYSAKENGFIQNEALGNELAAKFWLEKGKEEFAQLYMRKAHYGYQLWGAKRKVEELEQKYPQLLPKSSSIKSITSSRTTTTTTTTGSQSSSALDLATFMKASQAISGEIVLDKLLENLMKILIENAGAQTGFLILDKAGKWVIEASGEVDVDNIAVLQSIRIEQHLPISIVNYVTRTRETVVKTDAANQGKFTNDPYIKANQTKAILCAPLINQGQLSGIVYLENNLTTGAFTPDRLEVIQLLSGQAAIAITNAKLYAEVKESERRLTQYLEAMPVGVAVHDSTGQIHYANQTAQQLIGLKVLPEAKTEQLTTAFQIYRAGTEQLYPTDQMPIVRSLAGETAKADDLELHQPDKILSLEVSTTPIFDETGKIAYAIAAFQDISDRKQAQKILEDYNRTLERQVTERTEALQEKNQQLAATLEQLQAAQNKLVESEKMASLGGLVAGVAHEINTPVGIGITAASLLAEKTTAFFETFKSGQMKRSQLEKFLDTAMQSSSMVLSNLNRAADLISSFKQVAVDQSTEEQRTFNLKQYLSEVLIPLKPKLRTTHHRVEIKGDEAIQLNTYPGALSQIITNLVMNSLTHAYSPRDAGNLVFEFFQEGKQIIFEYSDDGKGIPQDNLSKIFDPFFTTKRGQGGSGLGLHIVYNLVTQKLNGTIKCNSQVGVGTKFTIELPCAPSQEL